MSFEMAMQAVYGDAMSVQDEAGGAQKAGKPEAQATQEFTFKPRINDYSKVRRLFSTSGGACRVRL